jgi:hypothetical protein
MRKRNRRSRLSALGPELTSVLRRIGKTQRGIHPEIWARWSAIVGSNLAKRAYPRELKKGVLTIAVGNSAWMQELSFLTTMLKDRFAEEIGPRTVREIRLVLDTSIQKRNEKPPEKPPAKPHVSNAKLPPEIIASTQRIKDKTLREIAERAARANLVKNE